MKFSVNPKIFEKFTGVEIGVLVIAGMDNHGHNEQILSLLREEEKRQKKLLQGVELGSLPEIASWRNIYREFGSGTKDFRSSVESLLRRARGGDLPAGRQGKPLPQINNLVDLYNYLSLKYHLPAGAEDLDKVAGDIELIFAQGNEKGVCLGSEREETCEKGEVIYKDQRGFICRRWNWREADRTKIDFDSQNAVLVIEKVREVDEKILARALDEGEALINEHLKGKVQRFVLTAENSFLEIDFEVEGRKDVMIDSKRREKKISIVKKDQDILVIFGKDIDTELVKILKEILVRAFGEVFPDGKITKNDIKIERPNKENYGDYSTNLALTLSGRLKIKPLDIAKKLSRKINEYIREDLTISFKTDSKGVKESTFKVLDILENVKFEAPGFINLFVATKFLITSIAGVLKKEETSKSGNKAIPIVNSLLDGQKIMVEYTDPNPFKEFHVGHLYSNAVGESLSRLFEYFGAEVRRSNYFGDVGLHVAKSLYGFLQKWKMENRKWKIKVFINNLEKRTLTDRLKFLGEAYALGASAFEKDNQAKEEIKEINLLVFAVAQEYMKEKMGWRPQVDYKKHLKQGLEKLEEVKELFGKGREWSLAYFETIYKILGTKFDYYYPESIVGEYGMQVVHEFLPKGVFEESEGAIIFRGEKFGLHTRVFINTLGLPTYETKELGLALAKYKDYPYDFSLIVTGKEINEYFDVLMAVMGQVKPELRRKNKHLGHGMVRLPSGKMSSRTGEILRGEWLLDEIKNRILKILDSSGSDYSSREKETIAQRGAVAAVKYSLLKVGLPSDITFDLEKSVSFEGDSGPYLMYTYARCKSVQRKSKVKSQKSKVSGIDKEEIEPNPEELALLKTFIHFDEVVLEAAKNLSPNLVCTYLYDLAQKYNLFYQRHSILGIKNHESRIKGKGTSDGGPERAKRVEWDSSEVEELKNFRLVLTEATANIIKKGLDLLGIATVERM